MLRRVINPILFLPLALSINPFNVLASETKNYIDNVLEEKSSIIFVDYQEIEKIVLNNQELKSLKNLVTSARFNLSSKIAQKYPSLDFQANGLPKYVVGKNKNSNSTTLKTSQLTANPSLNIKWDLIDPHLIFREGLAVSCEVFKVVELLFLFLPTTYFGKPLA